MPEPEERRDFSGYHLAETLVSTGGAPGRPRTVKEPGNATSLARNILVNLLEPTAMASTCSLWQASDPKGLWEEQLGLASGKAGEKWRDVCLSSRDAQGYIFHTGLQTAVTCSIFSLMATGNVPHSARWPRQTLHAYDSGHLPFSLTPLNSKWLEVYKPQALTLTALLNYTCGHKRHKERNWKQDRIQGACFQGRKDGSGECSLLACQTYSCRFHGCLTEVGRRTNCLCCPGPGGKVMES
ncbi:hypothetical protein AV530_007336 [Patagioenas fasciata monilis]|uniref:Uncharacterized protein n=1 Tax=Patagioenas fasciata monilis TaxID=372326 RepID=A0A1V4JXN5_PATFA|nr:hypothetical protein AV530_007336 [Patagioenas fasciata monilis]